MCPLMASQVAHIIYAEKYFKKYPSKINRDEFILGCVFPDIRRIDENVKRKMTHRAFDPLDLNFEGLTSFQAGWKFHLYCDMKREEILNKYKFYELEYTADFWHHPSKMLEDELIYDEYENWEKLAHYFNSAPHIEAGIGVSQETFSLWYAILAKYVESKPGDRSMRVFLSKQRNLSEMVNELAEAIDKLRKNDKVGEILKKVAEEIV